MKMTHCGTNYLSLFLNTVIDVILTQILKTILTPQNLLLSNISTFQDQVFHDYLSITPTFYEQLFWKKCLAQLFSIFGKRISGQKSVDKIDFYVLSKKIMTIVVVFFGVSILAKMLLRQWCWNWHLEPLLLRQCVPRT